MTSALRHRWNLSRWALAHPWLTVYFWLAIAVAGLVALSGLKYALFPEVTFPVVVVQARGPADGVLATEKNLTEPLEKKLLALPQATVYSSTYQDQSVVSIAFEAGSNLSQMTTQVKGALQGLTLPPQSSLDIFPLNLNESVAVTYALGSEQKSLGDLALWANQKLVPALKNLPGVLTVNLLGDGDFRSTQDRALNQLNPPTLTRYNGKDVLAVQVIKTATANTLALTRQADSLVQKLQKENPDVALNIAESQARYIQEATTATLEALGGAVVLAVLITYPFLNSWRATFISALAIPLSLLGTFVVMAILGFNLETLTLLALALVIGIVVDDAIVDIENISRHIEMGAEPKQAALMATDEIGLTMTATTFTIVVVFLPIAFIGGTLGQFFKPFALTVATAVLISWLVARTLAPVLAVFWLRPRPLSSPNGQKDLTRLTERYGQLLVWSLHRPRLVMAIALMSLVVGLGIIPLIPQGFVPTLDRGEFNVVYRSEPPTLGLGKSLSAPESKESGSGAFAWLNELTENPQAFLLRRSRRIATKLEPVLQENESVIAVFTLVGVQGNPLKGRIYVELKPNRSQTTATVQSQVRSSLPVLPKVNSKVENILFVQTGDDSPLKLALVGQDLKLLRTTAQKLQTRVKALPGLVQVELTGQPDGSQALEHYQGQRVIYLTANLLPDAALGEITRQVEAIAAQVLPPQGVAVQLQGESARASLVLAEFGTTLLISLLAMMLVFWGVFRRALEPLVIVLSLPLAIVGAMVGLFITQSDFGMISLIGLIFLLGLLDKNAVLLMDYTNQLRSRGLDRETALIQAGQVRFRPILMTTLSTILGMLPLALGLGAGAELRQPMAVAIMGGLITSSLLSLIVVPVLYNLLDRSEKLSKKD